MRIHKRPDSLLLRAAGTLLFLALCAWLGAGFYGLLQSVGAASAPTGAETGGEIRLHGVAVRREQLLCSRRRVKVTATGGKRLPYGGELAVTAGGSALCADCSAVFFADWDGLEWLDPDALTALDVPAAEALLEAEPHTGIGTYGRLVSGGDWYYAALTDAALSLAPGDRCQLLFDGFDRALPASLLSVSGEQAGQRAVLLRLTEGGADCLSLRKCDARLLFFPEPPLAVRLQ